MRKLQLGAIVLLLTSMAMAGNPFQKQKNDSGRLLSGKVLDHGDKPVPNSVVFLTNTRTRAVKSYIVGEDGAYHFPALAPNIDYEVYAQYKSQKSDTKTLSQFDDRAQVSINLRVDLK
jgi:hypothetical protein